MADTATVHVGYVTYGPNADEAYAKGSKLSSAIVAALKNAGVHEDAIESASQNLTETPQFELEKLPPAEQAQRRFQLDQSWTVKTAAKDAASALNAAVNAGANRSGAIDWSVKDENGLEAQAAAKALARAHEIAAQMAKGLGIQLGALLYASNQPPQHAPGPLAFRAMAASPQAKEETKPLVLRPQKVERSATVYAVFAIQ
jgi:uncharacterized protein YggE